MASLTPGTKVEGSSDPRTVEQNQAIAAIQSPDTSAIQPKYGGFLMTPDGKLTNDISLLNIPDSRREEIQKILDAKSVVLMLNEDGVPVQFYPTGVASKEPPEAPATEPAPVPPTLQPIMPVKTVDANEIIRISKNQFKKTYVQDSMATLDSDSILFENISVNFSVKVNIEQLETYQTDIVTFELQPKEKREVKIIYDVTAINKLPEGIIRIYPSINYTINPISISPPVEKPVVIIPKPEVVVSEPDPQPLPVVEYSPPIYVEPKPIPFGRWVLTKVSDPQTTTEKVVRFVAEENGQLPSETNNWIGGVYKTVYGTIKTTTIPAQYDYILEGDIVGAGSKPTVQNEAEKVTYSSDEILENTLLYQRESDIRETQNIALQMNVPVPTVEPQAVEAVQKTTQVLVEEPVVPVVEQPVSTGGTSGGGEVLYDQQNEQVSFYRKLSQLEFAE